MSHKKSFAVGIFGLAGSGKSSSAIFLVQLLNWQLLDADLLCHKYLMNPKHSSVVASHLGESILDEERTIDKKKLRDMALNDPFCMKFLENMLWPRVEKQIAMLLYQKKANLVIDAAVLFLAGWHQFCDFTVYIDCPIEIRNQRLLDKGYRLREIENLAKIQQNIERSKHLAHRVIVNAGSLEDLQKEILNFSLCLPQETATQEKAG